MKCSDYFFGGASTTEISAQTLAGVYLILSSLWVVLSFTCENDALTSMNSTYKSMSWFFSILILNCKAKERKTQLNQRLFKRSPK